ncbi:hypothetical protein SHJG_5292 [Streptomyces hygroscopicus subsp. jinggangensis 5008]|nr:hypothetical protein SHJG_5292 [Streptomyces hygroscopicus subsp. jinggangensis 5008]AGF64719.1 hypothetical protein SHJGH_5056 [Streptomyces hygroscopicus subsp. jinggangensis TL01]
MKERHGRRAGRAMRPPPVHEPCVPRAASVERLGHATDKSARAPEVRVRTPGATGPGPGGRSGTSAVDEGTADVPAAVTPGAARACAVLRDSPAGPWWVPGRCRPRGPGRRSPRGGGSRRR